MQGLRILYRLNAVVEKTLGIAEATMN